MKMSLCYDRKINCKARPSVERHSVLARQPILKNISERLNERTKGEWASTNQPWTKGNLVVSFQHKCGNEIIELKTTLTVKSVLNDGNRLYFENFRLVLPRLNFKIIAKFLR